MASAEKLFKRLIVSGEAGLRQMFLRGLAVAAGKIEYLNFQETDPSSDLAQISSRLDSAMEALRQKQAEQEAQAKAAEENLERSMEALFSESPPSPP